jgi:hypothetical protein
MNREFFAIGIMEYGGLGLLIVVGLFIAVLDLARAILLPPADRSRMLQQGGASRRPYPQTKQSQINQ